MTSPKAAAPGNEGSVAPMDERLVTVCDSCFCASCWNGLFYCDDYIGAGTVDLPVSRLRELNREHPSYYDTPPTN